MGSKSNKSPRIYPTKPGHNYLQISDLVLPDLYKLLRYLQFTPLRVLDIGFNGLVQGPWTSRTSLRDITQISIFGFY